MAVRLLRYMLKQFPFCLSKVYLSIVNINLKTPEAQEIQSRQAHAYVSVTYKMEY